jgi:hypothetical protein
MMGPPRSVVNEGNASVREGRASPPWRPRPGRPRYRPACSWCVPFRCAEGRGRHRRKVLSPDLRFSNPTGKEIAGTGAPGVATRPGDAVPSCSFPALGCPGLGPGRLPLAVYQSSRGSLAWDAPALGRGGSRWISTMGRRGEAGCRRPAGASPAQGRGIPAGRAPDTLAARGKRRGPIPWPAPGDRGQFLLGKGRAGVYPLTVRGGGRSDRQPSRRGGTTHATAVV